MVRQPVNDLVEATGGLRLRPQIETHATIAISLDRLGLEANDEERERLLALVKQRSLERKHLLSEKEFRDLYEQVAVHRRERAVV